MIKNNKLYHSNGTEGKKRGESHIIPHEIFDEFTKNGAETWELYEDEKCTIFATGIFMTQCYKVFFFNSKIILIVDNNDQEQ